MPAATRPLLAADYFDGQQARAQPVSLQIDGGELVIGGLALPRRIPVAQVRWAERQRHGVRLSYLPGESLLSVADGPAWDAWAHASGLAEPAVVRWMQSWRRVAAAALACVVLIAAAWHYGVPHAADALVAVLPPAVERSIGDEALRAFDQRLAPSRLSAERQQALQRAFDDLLARAYPPGQRPACSLHLRAVGRSGIDANAFALPGGHIVLTDPLAEMLADRPDVLLGALAHEVGHVRQRHGLRLVVKASLWGVIAGGLVGDVSTLLAVVPVVLTQQAYSREAEREADAEARRALRAAGISPAVMGVFFDRIEARQQASRGPALPIALASHPADDERRRFFETD
ncbi:MAG TPA: M48 family metallopeptidase [Ideonella sp.]|nr:M48 family metallopeptidase [Ideonella sp.]